MPVAEILERLDALGAEDFASDLGMETLTEVCSDLEAAGSAGAWLGHLFLFMERLDDVDLGAPGPVVHLIESCGAQYHPFLVESIGRKPTLLTVWMVNRAANADPGARGSWRSLLQVTSVRTDVSQEVAAEAADFLGLADGI